MSFDAIKINPLAPALGAEIGGVDLSGDLSDGVIAGIRQALLDHLKTIQLAPADAILLSMGVNDTTGLTSRRRYREQLRILAGGLPKPLYLLSVPPMHRFTALPSPLRQLLGWRARQLDAIQQQLARERPDDFIYLSYPPMNDPALLAEDGYHPSEKGYAYIAEQVAGQLRPAPFSGAGVDVTKSP